MEYVDVEEVEEEDPDVYFKRKREGGSRRKRVVTKPRRYAPTVIAEGESSVVPAPPVPLVLKLCNTPFPEYVLNCVFSFSIVFFDLLSVFDRFQF